jgi:RNA polymerase sigma-70 factor (ECF subfamily)
VSAADGVLAPEDRGLPIADIRALEPALRSYAARLLGSSTEAEDLVQDALLKAWRYRASYSADVNLKGWLFRIVRNEFLTAHARRRPTEAIDDKVSAGLWAPESEDLTLEVTDTLAALAALPATARETLLWVGRGDSYEEIAARYGCAVGSVKTRVNRARRRLVAVLEQRGAQPRRTPYALAAQAR